jgi:hypothetical protein
METYDELEAEAAEWRGIILFSLLSYTLPFTSPFLFLPLFPSRTDLANKLVA